MGILDRFRLDGKVAIVTGAGKGIGAAIAVAYAQAGADVVLAARTREDLERVAQKIRTLGRRALVLPTDVLQEDQLERLVQETLSQWQSIDVLVNNAGGYLPKPALATRGADMEQAFRFNVSTAFVLSSLVAPHMARQQGGAIVNISSVVGQEPSAGFVAYGTAKCALSFMTRQLAEEFAPRIRVNAIAVGSTRTEALQTVLTPEVESTMQALTPLGRLGEVEDMAACALYLASPAAAYVSGEVIGVHGGLNGLNMKMPRAFDG
jgi:7-alpha-hydroxysteroid dehydrogenase